LPFELAFLLQVVLAKVTFSFLVTFLGPVSILNIPMEDTRLMGCYHEAIWDLDMDLWGHYPRKFFGWWLTVR